MLTHLPDQPQTLMNATITLTKDATEKELTEISHNTSIPIGWLRKFSKRVYSNPSVNRVQYLYEYLTGTKLI